jgi:glucose/mannose-6-phosphate isomerase
LAVTTDGQLKHKATENGIAVLCFHYPAQPRAALGYSFLLILGALIKLGYLTDKTTQVEETAMLLEGLNSQLGPTVLTERNLAKQLAQLVYGRLPVVYGGGILAPVARRWKGQFNENSKTWAFFEELPELNHNALVGYQFPDSVIPLIIVIMLRGSLDHPRVKLRSSVTQDILSKRGIACHVVEANGDSDLAQMMSAIIFGDYTSYYLAMMNRADPTPVENIVYLKEKLLALGGS